ncbi:hypothetical protein T439DRAFT_244950 [Meredithblackwellia eburnea MCA 4105]
MESQDQTLIFDLPPEILVEILSNADPTDASRFTQTCKQANVFSDSYALNKQLFLRLFDPPAAPAPSSTPSYDFKTNLRSRIHARQWLASGGGARTIATLASSLPVEYEKVLATLVDVAETRSKAASSLTSRNQDFLDRFLPCQAHAGGGGGAATRRRHRLSRRTSASENDGGSSTTTTTPNNVTTIDELTQPRLKGGHALRYVGGVEDSSQRTAQLASKLKVLHTPSHLSLLSPQLRTSAREVVYDQRQWLRSSQWGPFVTGTGGSASPRGPVVDWHKLEAVALVMAANLKEVEPSGWGGAEVVIPEGWNSTRPVEIPSDAGRDWAGVEAQPFVGTYAFLDYRSFEHFNFHRSPGYTPTLEDETEAVGDCMKLTLKIVDEPSPLLNPGSPLNVNNADAASNRGGDSDDEDDDSSFRTRSSPPISSSSSSSGDEEMEDAADVFDDNSAASSVGPSPATSETSTGGAFPPPKLTAPSTSRSTAADGSQTLAFQGTSERLSFQGTFATAGPVGQPRRTIYGTVNKTSEGQVHWTFVICYNSGPQWLMHGIQVGGVRSKYGIVGVWSTADHDEAGPNGPFWYWPHSDTTSE